MHAFRSYIFAARIACDSGPTCCTCNVHYHPALTLISVKWLVDYELLVSYSSSSSNKVPTRRSSNIRLHLQCQRRKLSPLASDARNTNSGGDWQPQRGKFPVPSVIWAFGACSQSCALITDLDNWTAPRRLAVCRKARPTVYDQQRHSSRADQFFYIFLNFIWFHKLNNSYLFLDTSCTQNTVRKERELDGKRCIVFGILEQNTRYSVRKACNNN